MRVYNKEPHELLPGEYGKWDKDNHYYAIPPETDLVANLSSHTIVEHSDGSITVTPSILVSNRESQWHGYITNGEWSKC